MGVESQLCDTHTNLHPQGGTADIDKEEKQIKTNVSF